MNDEQIKDGVKTLIGEIRNINLILAMLSASLRGKNIKDSLELLDLVNETHVDTKDVVTMDNLELGKLILRTAQSVLDVIEPLKDKNLRLYNELRKTNPNLPELPGETPSNHVVH